MSLESLKKEYSGLAKKYDLPSFKEMNENFEVEKIDKDSDTPLRVIRKVVMEKVLSSLSFVELLLNPMNAPRMYLSYINSMTSEDRRCIEKIYSALSEVSISALDAEIDYSEESEARLVRDIFGKWESVKPEFRTILKNLRNPGAAPEKKERSYFG